MISSGNSGRVKLLFRTVALFGIAINLNGCEKEIPEIFYERLPEVSSAPLLKIPEGFPAPFLPENNPLSEHGISLGRKLFYDPILSKDGSISCGSCHIQERSFADTGAVSFGVNQQEGTRNSMAIINPAWQTDFFWDGRAHTLKQQAFEPVPNLVEMHLSWPKAIKRLQNHPEYPALFEKAFGSSKIDSGRVAKAIEQFELTFVSGNSRYDKFATFRLVLNQQELSGHGIFFGEAGDCFHCHKDPLFTDNEKHNNGLDTVYVDNGLGDLTLDPKDDGKFRTPTLRNIALTAPYMHDGRFKTLREVIVHYSEGLQPHPNIDPLLKNVVDGGVRLSNKEIDDLIAFLHTLTDEKFIQNQALSDPNGE